MYTQYYAIHVVFGVINQQLSNSTASAVFFLKFILKNISTPSLHWERKQGHNNIKIDSLITVTTSNHNERELLWPLEKWLVNMTHSSVYYKYKPLYCVYLKLWPTLDFQIMDREGGILEDNFFSNWH